MLNTGKFAGRTVLITGASRGIGKEIGLKLAKDGANIVIAAKTATAHPKLPGTIYTAAEEMKHAGGKALACVMDVRDDKSVQVAVEQTVKKFGGIDILVNNASALGMTNTEDTDMKRYDLMMAINQRGTFLMTKTCLPYLKQGKNPHVLNIAPPLPVDKHWYALHCAYTMSKIGMSQCVLGHSGEFLKYGIGVNALWPLTAIRTAAMDLLAPGNEGKGCRKPEIVADAAYAILLKDGRTYTGNFCIDEDVLKAEGVTEINERYAIDPKARLLPDFFLSDKDHVLFQTFQKKEKCKKSEAQLDKEVEKIVALVKQAINKEPVSSIDAVYQFNLTGKVQRSFVLDLKKEGSFKEGTSDETQAKITLDATEFLDLFSGGVSTVDSFLNRRMKIEGSLHKAKDLAEILPKIKKMRQQ